MKVRHKFAVAFTLSVVWALVSAVLAEPWIHDLSMITGVAVAYFLIYGIAVIPGWMNSFIAVSMSLDRRPARRQFSPGQYPPITVIIAAFNESHNITETLRSFEKQTYPGYCRVIVANDGSSDDTADLVRRYMVANPCVTLMDHKKNRGKSWVLNDALAMVETDITITLDGDSYLHPDALKNIVERYLSDPPETAAVAGSIYVRNSRKNVATRTQHWDYYLGIGATKRLQSFYHGTLVAQGAFSLYDTGVLRRVGGWPHCVGEDIVLSWAILKDDHRIGHAEDAVIFTNVPESWKIFIKQRQRWSRGLVEAFKEHWGLLFKPRMTTIFIWWNLLFPWLDVAYSFGFVPGVILALFGIYWIAGPMTLILMPFAIFLNWLMSREQTRVRERLGIGRHEDVVGLSFYILAYSMVLQPACVLGYIQEFFFGKVKSWGTK